MHQNIRLIKERNLNQELLFAEDIQDTEFEIRKLESKSRKTAKKQSTSYTRFKTQLIQYSPVIVLNFAKLMLLINVYMYNDWMSMIYLTWVLISLFMSEFFTYFFSIFIITPMMTV
jgi:hypothetical protein